MSLFSDLTARIQPMAETAVAAVMGPRDWGATLADTDVLIASLKAQRAELTKERKTLLADVSDPAVEKKIAQVERSIDDLNRQLARHFERRDMANERAQEKKLAQLNRKKQEMTDALGADLADWRKLAGDADSKFNDFLVALSALDEQSKHIWRKVGTASVGEHIGTMNRGAMVVVGHKLRTAGWPPVAGAPFGLPPDRRSMRGGSRPSA